MVVSQHDHEGSSVVMASSTSTKKRETGDRVEAPKANQQTADPDGQGGNGGAGEQLLFQQDADLVSEASFVSHESRRSSLLSFAGGVEEMKRRYAMLKKRLRETEQRAEQLAQEREVMRQAQHKVMQISLAAPSNVAATPTASSLNTAGIAVNMPPITSPGASFVPTSSGSGGLQPSPSGANGKWKKQYSLSSRPWSDASFIPRDDSLDSTDSRLRTSTSRVGRAARRARKGGRLSASGQFVLGEEDEFLLEEEEREEILAMMRKERFERQRRCLLITFFFVCMLAIAPLSMFLFADKLKP
ncbi:unnamed protein product [Amoebophrya sp. A25]|nr:unnamed protein product [Amoebophrya sp. A25]|eukprot:GSA25T00015232001.1